jgi:two-component system response regulator GlrR
LDEIGEMPLTLQAKLLRVLQEREITRVGSTITQPVNIRVIAATNRDLALEVHRGGFRQDLYYRLNVLEVVLPPLRERAGDVRLLAEAFLRKAAKEDQRAALQWTDAALEALERHDWPGNVRELQNFVRKVAVLSTEDTIDRTTVMQLLSGHPTAALSSPGERSTPDNPSADALGDFREERDRFESEYIRRVLRACAGNVSEAARRAGMSRRHFYEKLEKLGVNPDQFK